MTRFTLLFALIFNAYSFADSLLWGDSGIVGPKYSEILKQMETLETNYPHLATIYDYGKSVQNRPLKMLIVGRPKLIKTPRPAVLITGSIHGNEYLAIADKLPLALLKKSKMAGSVADYLKNWGMILFVPVVNPDGYEARKRHNAKGADLNRDWDVPIANHSGFKQPETKALSSALVNLVKQRNLDLKVVVDYHCCAGALLHPWSYTNQKPPSGDLAAHKEVGQLADNNLNIDVGTTYEILGYKPLGTTKDYYYNVFGALAFTYEGRYGKENKYFNQHVQWWEDIFSNLF